MRRRDRRTICPRRRWRRKEPKAKKYFQQGCPAKAAVAAVAENLDAAAAVSAEEYKVILAPQRGQHTGFMVDVVAADVVAADADREADRTATRTRSPR